MTKSGSSEKPRASLVTGVPLCIDPQHPSAGVTFLVKPRELTGEERRGKSEQEIQDERLSRIGRIAAWCIKYSRDVEHPCRWDGVDSFYITVDVTTVNALYRQGSRYKASIAQKRDSVRDGQRLPGGHERSEAVWEMIRSKLPGGITN